MGIRVKDKRCVFLDRDGVINEGYNINDVKEFKLFSYAADSIKRLRDAGFLVVVVSNQGGLGENLEGKVVWRGAPMTRAQLQAIHDEMLRLLGPASSPDLIKFCPHNKFSQCDCRKPKAGMLLEASEERDIDLSQSYMVGDRSTDIETGIAAGATPIFVQSGSAKTEEAKCPAGTIVKASLKEAVDYILGKK